MMNNHHSPVSDSPTFVLVHGAWLGSWCWSKVVAELSAQDHASALVDLPSSGADAASLGDLADDIAAVRGVLDAVAGPKVLVAHSYGGLPVSAAAVGRADVVAVVYVCAFVLDEGASLLQAAGGTPPAFWGVSEDGLYIEALNPEETAFTDCEPAVARAAAARLGYQSWSSVTTPLPAVTPRSALATYVVADLDAGLPPQFQEAMADGRVDRVVHLDSGHTPFLTRPRELSQLLIEAGSDTNAPG